MKEGYYIIGYLFAGIFGSTLLLGAFVSGQWWLFAPGIILLGAAFLCLKRLYPDML